MLEEVVSKLEGASVAVGVGPGLLHSAWLSLSDSPPRKSSRLKISWLAELMSELGEASPKWRLFRNAQLGQLKECCSLRPGLPENQGASEEQRWCPLVPTVLPPRSQHLRLGF